ncbi:NADP-dependent oxidoreductase domain-containing protein, partial [Baffinella frigidus]
GTLSGKYADDAADNSKSRHEMFPAFQPRYHADNTRQVAKEFAALAKDKGFKPAQLALKWAADREYMGAVIIGATTMEQLKDNIAAFSLTVPKELTDNIAAFSLNVPQEVLPTHNMNFMDTLNFLITATHTRLFAW